ncbi:hypothetical protein [Sphaerisporangium sp. NPDC051011]|uniref:DUF7665 family protein n=1 Tax=Sphaerisporangium sp. NPDC051011 TaxID=3155792 RepID=UPI0033EC5C2B
MPEPVFNPARHRLEHDLSSAEFESGVEAGLWRLVSLDWPHLIAAVTAGDGQELGMRFDVENYPGTAPAGQPWDLENAEPLQISRWPTGGSSAQIFRPDWSPSNGNAPYLACDRIGLATHPNWANDNANRAWNSGRTIVFYLRQLHHELRAAHLTQQEPA